MKPYWFLILVFLKVGVFCSIGQSIRVESAYYGSPNAAGVDVTRRVQQFADYGEPFRVGKETLRVDPFPNRRKSLVVIYEVNGHRISDSVSEADVFYFRTYRKPPGQLADHGTAVRITEARYGAWGRYRDVTGRVRALARAHRSFTVSNETFGIDPYPGRRKWLKISYRRGGISHNQQYSEGEKVRLK
jgi:hypothetical protein